MKLPILACLILLCTLHIFAQKAPQSVIYKITTNYSEGDVVDLRSFYFKADYREKTTQRTIASLTLLRVKIRTVRGEIYVPEIFDTDSLDESPFNGYNFYYYSPMIGKQFSVVWQDSSLHYMGENADSMRIAFSISQKVDQNMGKYLLQNDSGFYRFAKLIMNNKTTPHAAIEELSPAAVKGKFDAKYAFMLWDMMELQKVAREDSTSVESFLKVNDPLFGTRNTYRQLRLRLLQAINYPKYQSALKAMPIDLMKNSTSDLFNRISGADARFSLPADSIIKIIKLMKYYSRKSFLQESYCQSILYGARATEPDEKQRYKADSILLGKLIVSDIPNIKNQLTALSLMNKIISLTDTAAIIAYSREMDNCTSNDIIYGSLPRYRVIVEKHMQQNGLSAAAAAWREHTMQLVQTFNDSIKAAGLSDKYHTVININKALLADCWYRKYDETRCADSAMAFEYLLKTITDGPSSRQEMSDCFYDLAMTHGKGEYQEEVTAIAMQTGRKDVALAMLIKQQDMDHDKLEVLQQFYEKNYPGQSFSEFLGKDLVNRWKPAPDFDLQGSGNKHYKLSDYKGRWLLLDFWGSWCSPCCADLPALNALALQQERSNAGGAVLAIACHEEPETSAKYLQTKGYALSSAFSGEEVAQKFGVTGYPYKVLISPDGKMLPLVYGEDYSSIFKKYMAAGTTQANKTSPDLQTKSVRD